MKKNIDCIRKWWTPQMVVIQFNMAFFSFTVLKCSIYNLQLIMLFGGKMKIKVIILIGMTFLLWHMILSHLFIWKRAKGSVCSSTCWKDSKQTPFSYKYLLHKIPSLWITESGLLFKDFSMLMINTIFSSTLPPEASERQLKNNFRGYS